MKPLSIVGALLIIAGILGFIFGGVNYSETETVAEVGNVELQDTDDKRIEIPPMASGAILVTGLVLFVVGMRRKN